MAFTIEFDDNRLKEKINDVYQDIHETRPLGASFVDFLSLGEAIGTSDHVYFRLIDNSDRRINKDSMLYVRIKEFIDLCIKDPSLYILDNFMFFLYLEGLTVPEHHIEFDFDSDMPVESLVNPYTKLSPFESAIKSFDKSNKSKNAITSVYTCDSIEDICMASLYHLVKLELVIKTCSNCGKYFVPLRRSDAIYCDRRSPFHRSKNCKEDGAHRSFEEKIEMNEVEKLRRAIYQAKQMRVRRNPDIATYKEKFEKWKTDVHAWKVDIKKGLKTSEEFIQWLNDSKKLS